MEPVKRESPAVTVNGRAGLFVCAIRQTKAASATAIESAEAATHGRSVEADVAAATVLHTAGDGIAAGVNHFTAGRVAAAP